MHGRSAVLLILRAAVDGKMLSAPAAGRFAARLEQLPEEQATPAWLVAEGILTADQVAALVSALPTQEGGYPLASAATPPAEPPPAKPALPRIRGYEVIKVLGKGGMGVVYRANQLRLHRPVAVKVMSAHVQMTEALRLRFEREARAAADLAHPNVVTIYEYGVVEGVPFFSMELVEGKSLDRFVLDKDLSIEGRLKLMRTVCEAVSYAHERGVIHRDLKPGNILVTAQGQPKVMDFGLAKVSESPDRGMVETLTLAGQILGTVPYMAPEQTLGRPEEIDVRTDVYALGVILYQVVTGRLPHEPRGEHVIELMRRIREEAPDPPSSVNRLVDDNLQTIILKALSKEKERRYQTAAALAADLGRYLADEPIEAKPPSAAYHVRRLARRYRIALVPAAAAFAIIILLVAVYSVRMRRERAEVTQSASEAVQQKKHAEKAQEDALQKEEAIRKNQVRSDFVTAAEKIDQGSADLAIAYLIHALRLDPHYSPAQARLFTLLGQRSWPCLVSSVPGYLAPDRSQWPRVFSPDGRWVVAVADNVARVWETATGKPVSEPMRHDAKVLWAVFSPDGQRVLTAAEDHAVRLWETASGKNSGIMIQHQGPVYAAIIAPEGQNIVTFSSAFENTADHQTLLPIGGVPVVQVWDGATGKAVGEPIRSPENADCHMYLSPDGRWVVTAVRTESKGTLARVIEVSTGRDVCEPVPVESPFLFEGFSPDGRNFLTSKLIMDEKFPEQSGFEVRKWETTTGKPVGQAMRTAERLTAFSPDGKLALAGRDDNFAVYQTETGRLLRQRRQRDETDLLVPDAFSPDDQWVVATQEESAWVLATAEMSRCKWGTEQAGAMIGQPLGDGVEPMRHNTRIRAAAFSPDSRWLATSSEDGATAIWAEPVSTLWDLQMMFRCRGGFGLSPDMQSLVICRENVARVWEASSGKPISEPMLHESTVSGALFDPGGRRVLTYAGNQARVWEASTGNPVSEPMRHEGRVAWAEFSPDGQSVLTVATDAATDSAVPVLGSDTGKAVRAWEAATGKPIGPSVQHSEEVKPFADALTLSSDGRWLLTCSGNAAQLWEAATGRPVGLPMRHDSEVSSAALSRDNRWAATGSDDKTVRLWEAGTGKPVGELMRHDYGVLWTFFSRNGSRILTSDGHAARVWEVPTGRLLSDATRIGTAHEPAFSPDGQWVTTTSAQQLPAATESVPVARVWDTESGVPVSDPVPVKPVAASAAGKPEITLWPNRFSYEVEFLWPFVEPGPAARPSDLAALIQLGEYSGGIVLDERSGAPRRLSIDERLTRRHLDRAHLSPAYEALARWILRDR
jgi:WD40 repeat protein/predicted Ser/Thr protein kinase